MRVNNKFNWRKNIGKRGVNEWLKNPPLSFEIHVDQNFLGMSNEKPPLTSLSVPFGGPLNIQIQNDDKWEPLISVGPR